MFIYDKAAQQKFVTNHISPFYFSIWGTQKICQMTKDLKGNWIPFTCFVLLIKFYVGCIETRGEVCEKGQKFFMFMIWFII